MAADAMRPRPARVPPPDNHVHSQWSYDTGRQASMAEACRRAERLGVPAVAFTEHLDFTVWGPGDAPVLEAGRWPAIRPLDVTGYFASIEECRGRFPGLRVLSGVETGEAHIFAGSLAAVLRTGAFDRVLGSLHALIHDNRLVDVGRMFDGHPADDVMRWYFAELVRLVEGSDAFEVLAHVDYPRRYWPESAGPYRESAFEEEYRTVLRALAGTGRVLEVNTRSPLASVDLVRWWHAEGGGAVSFGSDAHVPWRVGDRFDVAVAVVEAAGFRPGRDRFDFWRR
jgi:histidinol-phosphatase (PHP family)